MKKELPTFVVGDRVEWISSLMGKGGVVVAVVPARVKPDRILEALQKEHGLPNNYDPRCTSRNHESYIVAVDRIEGIPKKGKPVAYWPRVSLLKLEKRSR